MFEDDVIEVEVCEGGGVGGEVMGSVGDGWWVGGGTGFAWAIGTAGRCVGESARWGEGWMAGGCVVGVGMRDVRVAVGVWDCGRVLGVWAMAQANWGAVGRRVKTVAGVE